MSDWVLVPSLVKLRTEFNQVSPGRDKGSDGSIGDSNHTSSSDHTPDEDSDVLRNKDADNKNEVHALDIDSNGPWPGGPEWFDHTIKDIVTRHRNGSDNRLRYVIWNRKIAGVSTGWTWVAYAGTSDPHTGHAHFSSLYTTAAENDTSEWGIEMALDADQTKQAVIDGVNFVLSEAARAAKGQATGTSTADQYARAWRAYVDALVDFSIDEDALAELVATKVVGRLPDRTTGDPIGTPGTIPLADLQAAVKTAVKDVLTHGVAG